MAQDKVSVTHVLIPVSILALTVMLLFAYQAVQVVADRDALHVTLGQLDAPYADSQKVQAQLTALVNGAQKLSAEGDKDASRIMARLKELGVIVNTPAKPDTDAASPAPVPAAWEKPQPEPEKP